MPIAIQSQIYCLVLAGLVNFLVQVLVFRFPPRLSLMFSVLAGFAAGFISLVALQFLVFQSDGADALLAILFYVSLGYNYFQLISIGENSIRIRLLHELDNCKEGLTEAEILAQYDAKSVVEARLKRLTESGQMIQKDGRYFQGKAKLLYLAKVFLFLKWLILGRKIN